MTKEETLGMITLAIKNKNPKSILLKCNLLGYCRLRGKLLISGSFLYSINLKKVSFPLTDFGIRCFQKIQVIQMKSF